MTPPLAPFPEPDDMHDVQTETAARPTPLKKHRQWVVPVVLAAILLLAAGGAAAYWFMLRKHQATVASSTTSSVNTPAAPQPAPAQATPSSGTQLYTSNGQDLNLTFTYPSDWTVNPPSNKNQSDQPITVTSPSTTITNSAGKSMNGQVVVTIRPGNAQLSELAAGSAVVAADSVQIGYAKPTASQHQYPYLTFVRLSGGNDANNGFDEVIITGISKFTKGQNLSPDSLGQLDPVISARFTSCTATCGSGPTTALPITADTWQNDAPFPATLALFESLQLH